MAEFDPQSSDEELISAYCDGELRGAELARAEELVANRPECRQLLEEYRALRARLQEVPRRKLSGDFADRVLRRAERDMLVTAGPADALAYSTTTPARKAWHLPQGRRPWIYAAAAMAAALVIMLVESKDRAPQLAQQSPLPGHAELSAPHSMDSVDRPAGSRAPADAAVQKKDSHDQPPADDGDVKLVLDQLGWPAISQQVAQQAATIEQQLGGPMLPSEVLVVECSITPQNRTPDPMVASFLNNSIAVDGHIAKSKGLVAKADNRSEPAAADKDHAPEAAEMFFVVATPVQLEATLAELGNRPGVSVKLLTSNRLSASRKAPGHAGEDRRPLGDVDKEKGAATAAPATPGLNAGQSQRSANGGSQQSRAQRLDIPESLRRLVESTPSAAKSTPPAEAGKREADQKQSPPAPAAAPEQKPAELRQSATQSNATAEPPPLQRALFIVRVRAAE